ncbi:MAG: glutathione-disulfide reductase [Leptolyngbyaceae cyanobacterium]
MSYDFDLFVIGAGSGGIATARRAAEYGAKVGVAEYDRLGGTCVNRGCVPKKLMVYASHFPGQFEEAVGYGWSPVTSSCDWVTLTTAVNNEVGRLNGIYQGMLDRSKVEIFRDRAHFIDSHTLQVGGKTVTAEKVLIAVGGKPVKPDVPGIDHAITSDDIFTLPQQPKRMVIWGGGYIACEFACILNGLGTEVIQVIRKPYILNGFDDDLRMEIQEAMQRHGVRILTETLIQSFEKTDAGLRVTVESKSGVKEEILTDAVSLAATGRVPNLDNLGLENTKVGLKDGAIAVDQHSRTADPTIYAVGDCTNRMNLTPVAIAEGRAIADTEYGNKPTLMSHENVPTAIFTTPEAGTVGLSEQEAIAKYGVDGIQIFRAKFRSMYYVLPGKHDEKTLMKLVVHKENQRVLGAHMVGDYAGEIIQGIAIAVKMGATKADFDATVGVHPSSAEEFVTMR